MPFNLKTCDIPIPVIDKRLNKLVFYSLHLSMGKTHQQTRETLVEKLEGGCKYFHYPVCCQKIMLMCIFQLCSFHWWRLFHMKWNRKTLLNLIILFTNVSLYAKLENKFLLSVNSVPLNPKHQAWIFSCLSLEFFFSLAWSFHRILLLRNVWHKYVSSYGTSQMSLLLLIKSLAFYFSEILFYKIKSLVFYWR